MTDTELRLLLDYMTKKYDLLSYDLQVVRSRFDYHGATSQDMYDLIVSDTRVDTASAIFRELRQLLLIK
ncbi:MAG: hypothetical protein MR300_08665 [Ruminococcus sp.]|nr:hypothetical protein [Ruminococcus sp.]